jgi:hypothetical protein
VKHLRVVLLLALTLPATGCGRLEPSVRPYERGLLADPIMRPDPDPVSSSYMRRVNESGEGARGATGDTSGTGLGRGRN